MRRKQQLVSHVYDLEAENWTQSLSAYAILENGDEHYFHGPNAHALLANLMTKVGGTWLAHVGGRYDLLLLMRYLPRPKSLTVTGSTVLACDFGRGFVVRDSYPAWLCSLAKIGDAVGVKKMDIDRRFMRSLSPEDLKAYNRNDCVILRAGDILMRNTFISLGMDHKWTAGSAAVEGLRKMEPSSWAAMRNNRIDSMTAVLAKSTAPGGIVDCAFYGTHPKVYVYDVKSSYPSRYKEAPMGVGLIPAGATDWDHKQANLLVRWRTNRRILGVAPAKSRFTMSGSGLCEAWLTHTERMNLDPYIKEKSVISGYKPKEVLWIGREFANVMFTLKEKTKVNAEGKTVGLWPHAKLWANSLHGKFLEDPIKDSWTQAGTPEEYYEGVDMFRSESDIFNGGLCGPHYQPCMAALVYGRARGHLVSMQLAVEKAGGQFLYSDTDSIMTDLSPEQMPVALGTDLGQLAFEGGPYTGLFLGPKQYLLHKDGIPKKIASKGVPVNRLITGKITDGVYHEDEESKDDLRLPFFQQVLDKGEAKIMKTGVRSFVTGAKKANWHDTKVETRTVTMTWSGRHTTNQGPAPFRHYG